MWNPGESEDEGMDATKFTVPAADVPVDIVVPLPMPGSVSINYTAIVISGAF